MNRIVVVGSSGSGITTFSNKLENILNIKSYHLDSIFWNSDKTHIEREEFDIGFPAFRVKRSHCVQPESVDAFPEPEIQDISDF